MVSGKGCSCGILTSIQVVVLDIKKLQPGNQSFENNKLQEIWDHDFLAENGSYFETTTS